MGTIIILGVIALAVTGGVGLAAMAIGRTSRPVALLPAPSGERDAMSLQVDDVVNHLGDTFLVAGRTRCDESGRTFMRYRLDGDDGSRVLRARLGDRLRIELLEVVGEEPAVVKPPKTLTWDGVEYTLKGWGQVRTDHRGETGHHERRMEYFAYRAPGQRVMYKEIWGDLEVTLAGTTVEPNHLDFLPGDLVDH